MTLQLFHSEFPYTVYEENLIFFCISVSTIHPCHKAWLELTINYLVMTVPNWIVKCFRISKCKNRFFVFQTCCCHRDAKAMTGCKTQRKKLHLHNIYDLR
jgi:hypothetical protein